MNSMTPPVLLETVPPTLLPTNVTVNVSPSGSKSLASNWPTLMLSLVLTAPIRKSSTATGGSLPSSGGGGGGGGGSPGSPGDPPLPLISSDHEFIQPIESV